MQLSENANTIIKDRYLILESGETNWGDLSRRVGSVIASAELDADKRGVYAEKFSDIISTMKFIPGGRILRNAGRDRGSLFNCYHLPIGDSIDEIGECAANALKLWSDGGGIGINFSQLRPVGSVIKGLGGKSSGLVSFMRAIDGLAACIESGGSRRAASLGSCDISHPEIEQFIDAKLVDGSVSYFNISVNITKAFLESVLANGDWFLTWRGKAVRRVDAAELWTKILTNMVNVAEPGLLIWDNLTKNNSYYFNPIRGCNPCGEAALGANDVCCLGSLVLPRFVDSGGRTKWNDLEETIKTSVRFLDNVIDANKYRLHVNQIMAQNGRRIGLGVMGLAEYLFQKELTYGSTAALNAVEDLLKFLRDTVYLASVEIAAEKGSFPAYEKVQYHKASFIRRLPAAIRSAVNRDGIRNVTLLALAPTGTISLIPEVTGGIEPLFSKAYRRNDRVGSRVYVHPLARKYIEDGKTIPEWFVDTQDLYPEAHLEMQSACQKYVDGAVSKTINVPSTFTVEQLSSVLFEYLFDIKGVTVYRDGSRRGQILNHLSLEEATRSLKKSNSVPSAESVACGTGSCEM